MDGDTNVRGRCGDRDVARAHGRLQGFLSRLRQSWDEGVEHETDRIADEAIEVLDRLTDEAARVRPAA